MANQLLEKVKVYNDNEQLTLMKRAQERSPSLAPPSLA